MDFWTRGFGAGRSRTEDGGLDFGAKTQAAGRPEADGEGTSWPRRSPPKRVTEVRLDGKVAVLGCQAVSGWRWQWFRGVSANGGRGSARERTPDVGENRIVEKSFYTLRQSSSFYTRLPNEKALRNSLLRKAFWSGRYRIRTCDLYGVSIAL